MSHPQKLTSLAFSRDHIHAGTRYRKGEHALFDPAAAAQIVAAGSAQHTDSVARASPADGDETRQRQKPK